MVIVVNAVTLAVLAVWTFVLGMQARELFLAGNPKLAVGTAAQTENLSLPILLSVVLLVVLLPMWLGLIWTSDRADPAELVLSTPLAIGGWFIPVANLVLAGRAMLQPWRAVLSARRRDHSGPRPFARTGAVGGRGSGLVGTRRAGGAAPRLALTANGGRAD